MSAQTGATDKQIASGAGRYLLRYGGSPAINDIEAREWASCLVPPGYRIVGPGVELFVRCEACGGERNVVVELDNFAANYYRNKTGIKTRTTAPCKSCNALGFVPLEGATNG